MNEVRFERYIKNAIKAHDAIIELRQRLELQEEKTEALWRDYLNESIITECPIMSEVVIVKDGAFLYEIKFDVDDWTAPTVRRVDAYVSFIEIDR